MEAALANADGSSEICRWLRHALEERGTNSLAASLNALPLPGRCSVILLFAAG